MKSNDMQTKYTIVYHMKVNGSRVHEIDSFEELYGILNDHTLPQVSHFLFNGPDGTRFSFRIEFNENQFPSFFLVPYYWNSVHEIYEKVMRG